MVFQDRTEAGRLLAEKVKKYADKNTVVYGLPRGGVVIAAEIARELKAPLEVVIARKIGHPLQPEFGIAALSENGHVIKNEKYIATVDENWLAGEIERQKTASQSRRNLYTNQKKISAKSTIAILADDGIATGLTTKAAIADLRDQKPKKLILAVPVAPTEVADELKPLVDETIILNEDPDFLGAVGAYYEEFPQVSDEEVINFLKTINGLTN